MNHSWYNNLYKRCCMEDHLKNCKDINSYEGMIILCIVKYKHNWVDKYRIKMDGHWWIYLCHWQIMKYGSQWDEFKCSTPWFTWNGTGISRSGVIPRTNIHFVLLINVDFRIWFFLIWVPRRFSKCRCDDGQSFLSNVLDIVVYVITINFDIRSLITILVQKTTGWW